MNKNILIIGDSWGVPNYSKGWNTLPDEHTEFRLKKLGYNVFNYSLNGGSITNTIDYATAAINKNLYTHPNFSEWKLKRNTYAMSNGELEEVPIPDYRGEKIDWILWFYTEPLRSVNYDHCRDLRINNKVLDLHHIAKISAYNKFLSLVNICPNVKTAVIGGQAPIEKDFYEYHVPNFIIEDWRSEIVGKKLPYCVTLSLTSMIDRDFPLNTKEEKISLFEANQQIIHAMSDITLFFDRCHPGSKPHEELTEKLHQTFQTM